VTSALAFPELSRRIGLSDALDVVGYNYKEHLYENDRTEYSGKPIYGSENGHAYSAWAAVRDNDYISAQFLWTGIDFLGETHGWPLHGSFAGLLDTAGFEKIAYYRRQAMWLETPVLYIATRRYDKEAPEISHYDRRLPLYRTWNYTPGEEIEVICYTNCDQVAIERNGAKLAESSRAQNEEFVRFVVPFEAGTLRAYATDKSVEDTISGHGAPAAIKVEYQIGGIFGKYRFEQLEVSVVDIDGKLCTTDSTLINVEMAAPGKLLGIENGDHSDNTEYSLPSRRVYNGRLVVYAREPVGETAEITISGGHIKSVKA
jgi:hypothetical protein